MRYFKKFFIVFSLMFFFFGFCYAADPEIEIISNSQGKTLLRARIPDLQKGQTAIINVSIKINSTQETEPIIVAKKTATKENFDVNGDLFFFVDGEFDKNIFTPLISVKFLEGNNYIYCSNDLCVKIESNSYDSFAVSLDFEKFSQNAIMAGVECTEDNSSYGFEKKDGYPLQKKIDASISDLEAIKLGKKTFLFNKLNSDAVYLCVGYIKQSGSGSFYQEKRFKVRTLAPKAFIEAICQEKTRAEIMVSFWGYDTTTEKVRTRILYRDRTNNETVWKQTEAVLLPDNLRKNNACDPKKDNQARLLLNNLIPGHIYELRPAANIDGRYAKINYESVKIGGVEYLADGNKAAFRSLMAMGGDAGAITPHYYQCGNVWSDYAFSSGESFCKDGCLDTSMSMILAYWYQKDSSFKKNWDEKLNTIYSNSSNYQKKFLKLSESRTGNKPNPFSSYMAAKVNGYWWSDSLWKFLKLKPVPIKTNDPKIIERDFLSKGIPVLVYCTPSHASGRSNHFAVLMKFAKYSQYEYQGRKYLDFGLTNDSYYGSSRVLNVVADYNRVKNHKNPKIPHVPTCGYQYGISTENQFFGGLVAFVPENYYINYGE